MDVTLRKSKGHAQYLWLPSSDKRDTCRGMRRLAVTLAYAPIIYLYTYTITLKNCLNRAMVWEPFLYRVCRSMQKCLLSAQLVHVKSTFDCVTGFSSATDQSIEQDFLHRYLGHPSAFV